MSTVSADDVWGKRACRAGDPPGAQFCFYLLPNSPVPQSSSSQGIKAVSTSVFYRDKYKGFSGYKLHNMCYACWFIYLGFVFFKCAVSSLLQLHQMSTSYCFSLIPLWINVPIEPFSAVFVLFLMRFSWLICEIPSREKKWQSACKFQLHIYPAGRLERLERHYNLPRYQ